jgi:hypothetical protein
MWLYNLFGRDSMKMTSLINVLISRLEFFTLVDFVGVFPSKADSAVTDLVRMPSFVWHSTKLKYAEAA